MIPAACGTAVTARAVVTAAGAAAGAAVVIAAGVVTAAGAARAVLGQGGAREQGATRQGQGRRNRESQRERRDEQACLGVLDQSHFVSSHINRDGECLAGRICPAMESSADHRAVSSDLVGCSSD